MHKKVSVIIPIYNGQAFIERCVESVLRQVGFAKDGLEIILINDGSTDGSKSIIEKYAKLYPNTINAISQKNIGVARTRNKGISIANGQYVMLIDQDDWVDNDYVAKLYAAITSGSYDVVQSGYKLVDNEGRPTKSVLPGTTDFGKFLAMPAWAKIHKTQFLLENGIEFLDNNIGEDSIFTINEIISTKQYGTIDYCGYNNSFGNLTNVTNNFHKGLSEEVKVLEWLKSVAKLHSNDKKMQQYLQYNLVRSAVYYLLAYGRNASSERFMQSYSEIFGLLKEISGQKISVAKVILAPRGERISARVGVTGFILIHKMHLVKLFTKIYCTGK